MHRIRMLVYAYYDPSFRMGRFIKEYPHLKDTVTRVLIGDVFEDDLAELFTTLGKHLSLPESIELENGAATVRERLARAQESTPDRDATPPLRSGL
jgi:hypothetical protein